MSELNPTLYHIVTATDGTLCIQIEDSSFVAVGEHDIELLGKICDIARRELARRKSERTIYPELPR